MYNRCVAIVYKFVKYVQNVVVICCCVIDSCICSVYSVGAVYVISVIMRYSLVWLYVVFKTIYNCFMYYFRYASKFWLYIFV